MARKYLKNLSWVLALMLAAFFVIYGLVAALDALKQATGSIGLTLFIATVFVAALFAGFITWVDRKC